MRAIYSEAFRAELCCVAGRYGAESPELRDRFVVAVESAALAVMEDPLRWRIHEGRVRRCLVRGFPYILYYLVEDDVVFFGALLHSARHPEAYRRVFEDL